MKHVSLLPFVALLVLAFFMTLAVAEESKTGMNFVKDKTGYNVLSAETGKLEPVFWRKSYTHAACPFSVYENGQKKSYEVENCFDTPYMWGVVKGDHLELFEIAPGVMLGLPLDKLVRDPRQSEWWLENLRIELDSNEEIDKTTTLRQLLQKLVGIENNKSHDGLIRLIAKDMGAPLDEPKTGYAVRSIVRHYTQVVSSLLPPKESE
ncbi:MAG: hypothetical protein PHW95_04660 [Patescibacteria group bacterium]|nr:hypothetical protein [Patescibacteria group bacterium]